MAGEVRNPERNLPIGILVSLFLVTVVYALVVFVMAGSAARDVGSGLAGGVATGWLTDADSAALAAAYRRWGELDA